MPTVTAVVSYIQKSLDFGGSLTDGYFLQWSAAQQRFVLAPVSASVATNTAKVDAANIFTVSPQTIQVNAPANKGLVVQAIAAQTVNVFEVVDPSSVPLFGVSPGKSMQLYNTYTDTNNGEWLEASWASNVCTLRTNANGTGSTRPIKIVGKSPSGASSPVLEITNSAGEYFNDGLRITSAGYGGFVDFKMGTACQIFTSVSNQISMGGVAGGYTPFNLYTAATSTQRLLLTTVDAASKGMVVQGAATQSANLQEWQDSTGTVLSAVTASGAMLLPAGKVTALAVAFSAETNLGLYRPGTQTLGFVGGGTEFLRIDTAAVTIAAGNSLRWGFNGITGPDLFLRRDGPATLAQRDGVNPQALRVYNTYTDASNGEWLEASWASNVCTIQPKANGTGASRDLRINSPLGVYIMQNSTVSAFFQSSLINIRTYIQPNTDNAFDLGDTTHRFRNVYAAGGVATKVKAGTPVDADFTNPVDGMIAIDSTNNKIWVRIAGVWKGVAVT